MGKDCNVFKARKKGTIQYVVVKSVEKHRRARLLAEVSALSDLKGIRGVLQFFCWYETRNHIWLVVEYCPGGDLSQVIKEDKCFPESSIRAIGADIAIALFHVHARGVSHNGLCASNVLFCEDGSSRLGDFGSAGRLTDGGTGDLVALGSLLKSLGESELSPKFASLLTVLSKSPKWPSVISHEFWEDALKGLAPDSIAISAKQVTTPQAPALQPQQDLEVSVIVHPVAKPERRRLEVSLTSQEALAQSRAIAVSQIASLSSSPLPISEELTASETPRGTLEDFLPQALKVLAGDNPQTAFPTLVRFSGSRADDILRSQICPSLIHLLHSTRGAEVARILGSLLRHATSLEPPLWRLPASLASASRGPAGARALAALGEFLFYAATAKNQDWTEARGAAAEIRVALVEGEGATLVAALQTVENVSLVAQAFARKMFFSAEVLSSLCRTLWRVSSSMRSQVFSCLWFLSRVDPDEAESFPFFMDLEFSFKAVGELGRTRVGPLTVALLRWQLQVLEVSRDAASSIAPVLASLAGERSGAGALLCLCELLRTAGEAVAKAAVGGVIDRRPRKDKNFEDSLLALTGAFAAEAREGRVYPLLITSPLFAPALLNKDNLPKVLGVRGPRDTAAVAEALAGCSSLADWRRDVTVSFLPGVLDVLTQADDSSLRFQLLKSFCELAVDFIAQDDSALVVQIIAEKLAPTLTFQFLKSLEEPLPSLVLKTILSASAVSRAALNSFSADALVEFCLYRPTSPQVWELLAVLSAARLFSALDSSAVLAAVRHAIASAGAGEREEATAEAAAQMLGDALSDASPGVVSQRSAALVRLVGPCAAAAGFRWAAELLAALAVTLPSGALCLNGEDASSVAAALAKADGDWARVTSLVEVCGRVGSNSDAKLLSRGVADFLLKFREEAPAATVAAARKVFKALN